MKYIKRFGEVILEAKKKSKGKDYSNEPWFAKYQEQRKREITYPYVDEDLILKECQDRNLNISKIHPDGTVDIDGDVDLSSVTYLYKFRLKFGIVKGNFICTNTNLISLEGAPTEVTGNFWCGKNQLTNLLGSPKKVGGSFDCHRNPILSLEGGPEEVGGSYAAMDTHIRNLKGCPKKINGGFSIGSCRLLTTLEGGPEEVGGDFYCSYGILTSLKGSPVYVHGDFKCDYNSLTDLQGGPEWVMGGYYCSHNRLTNLRGLPSGVNYVECVTNDLTSLEGSPESLTWFNCSSNPRLTSLEEGPTHVEISYFATYCSGLYKMGKMGTFPRSFTVDWTPLKNLIEVFAQFKENTYNYFNDSLDYNYITTTRDGKPAIIKWRFIEALSEFDSTAPESVEGYEYID